MKNHGVVGGRKICLDCPYPRCIYDFKREKTQVKFVERMLRNDAIVTMSARKFSNKEIAEKFGLGERHIRRVLEQNRKICQLCEKEID